MTTHSLLMRHRPAQPANLPVRPGLLQRKCACGGTPGPVGECAECRRKKKLGLQTKLQVNRPGDRYEREADRVAERVMRSTPLRESLPILTSPMVQRKSSGDAGIAPAVVHEAIAEHGQALDEGTRAFMEPRFGHDFSRVRIHDGTRAAEATRSVAARAFTVGNDVVFGTGQYAPGTDAGRRLLAHELTHVIQQNGAASPFAPITNIDQPMLSRNGGGIVAGMKPAPGEGATEPLISPETSRFLSDLIASVSESPQHTSEIFGEVWESIKEHWLAFTLTMGAFIAAEVAIGLMAATPDPSMITKVVSAALQALVLLFLGFFVGVETGQALIEATNWWNTAKEARGDPVLISEASRSFCRMALHITIAILTFIGARTRPLGAPGRAPGSLVPSTLGPPRTVGGARPPGELVDLATVRPPATPAPARGGTVHGNLALAEVPELVPPEAIPFPRPVPATAPALPSPLSAGATSGIKAGPSGTIVGATAAQTASASKTQREQGCTEYPLGFHLGGDPIHNACADNHPLIQNIYPDSDFFVQPPTGKGKNFDAVSANGTLWEVKTETGKSATVPFLRDVTIAKYLKDADDEFPIARACGHDYRFAIANEELFNAALPGLTLRGVPVVHVPDCL